ncbi:hypothetical protein BD626DRAFT_408499 [Schizophyllum amplum]|uniref:Fe2OG dioxygenase domain-containing protein n=1 Tax=Schizophyllum amplum TaxID=97359 RepID=A0A550C555_9AGAR|nr:hypothetical protein BD626DRAFT_408499 [Auriculariopsis ampla]
MPRPARIAPQIPAAVTDRLSAFQKVFFSKPPFVSGVYSIDKADYLLYYGGPQNPRCIDLANAADADLQHLSDACAPATFGLNNTDVYDEDYRKARKMDVDAFSCKFDPAHSGLLELIWPEFLSDGGDIKQKVVCELYKLNVYGQGSFFKAHKDTPRSDTMFGSLVVVFPTPHEGGALILRENEKEWTFDSAAEVLADGSPKLGYVVFFSDVEHEVTKVTSGYRVTLTYNLYFNAKSTDEPTTLLHQPHLPSGVSKVGQELKIMLQDFLACPDFLPDGGFLGFGLRFLYPLDATKPVSTISSSLKGCDAMLQAVCDELGLQHSLHAVYKTSAGCDYYSGDSDGDKTVHIVRDTFWKGTHQQVDMDLYHYIRDKKSILLRAAGTRTFKDDYGKVVPTKEVHWVTKVPTQYNVVKSHYGASSRFFVPPSSAC